MKIANKFAPYANVSPDESYHENNRAWQGGPSIARTHGGRLFVSTMSGGIYEPDPRNYSLLFYSDDNGDTWSQPVLALESSPEDHLRRFELELWVAPNGALWGFWAEVPYPHGLSLPNYEQKIDMENDSEYHQLESQTKTFVSICENPDADELIWSEPRYLFPAVIRNKPFITDSGRWLFPTYITSPRDYFEFYYSDDEGKTLHSTRRYGRDLCRAYDEPNFYRMADGRIAVVVRTTPPVYKRMISEDDGLTWSEPEELMAAASERPCTRTLCDGSSVIIPSIHPKSRNGLKLMRSIDGVDFSDCLVIEDRERVSYAEIDEDENGTLYITYDRERGCHKKSFAEAQSNAREVLVSRITEQDILAGRLVSEGSYLGRIVSKLGEYHGTETALYAEA